MTLPALLLNVRALALAAITVGTLGLQGCANRDAKAMLDGGHQRARNNATLVTEEERARAQKIGDEKVAAEEARLQVDGMLKSAETQSNQLDADLARVHRQGKGSAQERARLSAELAEIKKQANAIQKPRAAQASPQELERSRKQLEALTARQNKLAGELQRALR